jgi:hypothetical protein
MSKVETVTALLQAIEAEQWSKAASYLTEDFTFSGAVPQPITGEQWLGVHRAMAAAFSNFSFNFRDAREENGKVLGTVQLVADHTSELRLPIPGIPAIPATGKHISLPAEPVVISFRDEKLVNYEVKSVPDSGVPSILKQIGAAPGVR